MANIKILVQILEATPLSILHLPVNKNIKAGALTHLGTVEVSNRHLRQVSHAL